MWNDVRTIDSDEGNVSKYVFTADNLVAEAVLYRYPTYQKRTVICCSTQSGCPVGCRFCGAGDFFVRSLNTDQIVSQVQRCIDDTEVDPDHMERLQVMFMSMGEPLVNMKAMAPALRTLHVLYPNAALLISTIGPKINYTPIHRLSAEIPTIGLQFSVHESTDAARDRLIPFSMKLKLSGIALEGRRWHEFTERKPFFNYCAADHNITGGDADRLRDLFPPSIWNATVSVICERNEGLPAKNAHQIELAAEFSQKLLDRGFDVRVFDPAGQDDIGGGCGQLWFIQQWAKDNSDLVKPSVGSGMPVVHTPT